MSKALCPRLFSARLVSIGFLDLADISKRSAPQRAQCRCDVVVTRERSMTPDQARQRAEKSFRQEERAPSTPDAHVVVTVRAIGCEHLHHMGVESLLNRR